MKKHGTLNAELSRVIASMGHSDRLVICDSGLPLPRDGRVVDLALTTNIPRFLDTVRVVLEELQVEKLIVAHEMIEQNSAVYEGLLALIDGTGMDDVSHDEFKQLTLNGERS